MQDAGGPSSAPSAPPPPADSGAGAGDAVGPDADGWERAFPARQLGRRAGARVAHIAANGRRVTVLRLADGALACIDTACFHTGGPLGAGDMEELGSGSGSGGRGGGRGRGGGGGGATTTTPPRTCLVCPWHHYRVDVRTGEGMYLGLDGVWASKGVRQRVHDAAVRGADGSAVPTGAGRSGLGGLAAAVAGRWVYVRLREAHPPTELPSDVYAYGLDALVERMRAAEARKKAERERPGR